MSQGGFSKFIGAHLGPSIIGGGGALIGVWGFLGDAQSLWTAGVKPGYLQLSGFVLFVVGVVSVLYRQQSHIEEQLAVGARALNSAADLIISTPEPVPAPALASPTPPRPEGRQYVPARFVADLTDFVSKTHTDLQRQAYLRPHRGQWVRARGTLRTTTDHGTTITAHVGLNKKGGESIFVEFSNDWRSQLSRLAPDEEIEFEAQIVDDHFGHPRLGDAALL